MPIIPLQPSRLTPLVTQSAVLLHHAMVRLSKVAKFSTASNENDISKKIKEQCATLKKLSKIEPALTDSKKETSLLDKKNEDSTSSVIELFRKLETEQKIESSDTLNNEVKPIVNPNSEVNSKYVKICDRVFNKNKIESAYVRDSYFYIKFPYVLEFVYQQPHTYYLGDDRMPISSDTTTYKVKYTHKEEAEEDCQRQLAAKSR